MTKYVGRVVGGVDSDDVSKVVFMSFPLHLPTTNGLQLSYDRLWLPLHGPNARVYHDACGREAHGTQVKSQRLSGQWFAAVGDAF